jgi:hypothetical protein
MITLVKPSIRGYGILFFGGLLEGRGAYEILVSEEDGAPRISGHFAGKVKVPGRHGTTTMILANGQRIKLQIRGNPESTPLRFGVVDDESIAICRDLT